MARFFAPTRPLAGWLKPALLAVFPTLLFAEAPSPPMAARFLKVLAMATEGSPRVAARDAALLAEFKGHGVTADPSARVAWAANEAELRFYLGQRRLVVAPSLELLGQGAAIALRVESGKLDVSYHLENARKAGQSIPDLVLKIGVAR